MVSTEPGTYDPLAVVLPRCERNYRIPRPLWLRTLHANFIWLVGIDAVHASVDAAAGKRKRCNLPDVLATKASSVWPAYFGRRKGRA